ncbi:MAG TPA: hypothetical protein OIM49_04355 [Clostridiaceae bacterium]|nr:hypothetical protein [Clostridiaceae bacterium]
MNQILSFQTIGNSKIQLKKVIRFFSIFIILFALILVIEGSFGYYKNKNKKVVIKETPDINIQRDNGTTILNITSNIGVQKVIYSWNDGIEDSVEEGGKNNIEVKIPTTIGTNDLNIKIIDSNGNTIVYNPVKISYEENQEENVNWEEAIKTDKTKPKVSIESVKGKIVITATDDVKMSYVTYSWNEEEENKITGLSDDEKTLTTEIDSTNVKKGTNKLIVKAYDKAGNVETVEKEVQGANGSEIKVNQENGELVVNVKNDINITKIEYNFNGEEKTIDNINQKEYTFKLQMKDGENKISISAYADALKSDYQNTFTKEITNTNTSAPTIKVLKDSNQIIINVKDESNITKIIYNFNGQEKTIDNINQKEYQLKLDLIDGTNYVIVNAYNQNNKSEYKGKTTK